MAFIQRKKKQKKKEVAQCTTILFLLSDISLKKHKFFELKIVDFVRVTKFLYIVVQWPMKRGEEYTYIINAKCEQKSVNSVFFNLLSLFIYKIHIVR